MNLTFNTDGTATCLYGEEIDLRTLGRLTVARASMVEFNTGTQEWEVTVDDVVRYHHSSREQCLAWEKENL